MKFKVGDKVRFVKKIELHSGKVKLGGIYKIEHIERNTSCMPYRVENGEGFNEKELELASYTYEDLKKSPIGTKITFENGTVLVKDEEYYFENVSKSRDIANLYNLKDNYSSLGKIIKIEEPEYKTVYESKVEILDEVEKRYLRGVIRPFEVKYIEKGTTRYAEFIYIKLKKEHISLPDFEPNTMYKGMEINKKYTLEELGL